MIASLDIILITSNAVVFFCLGVMFITKPTQWCFSTASASAETERTMSARIFLLVVASAAAAAAAEPAPPSHPLPVLWNFTVPFTAPDCANLDVAPGPQLIGDLYMFPTNGGTMYAVNVTSHAVAWKREFSGRSPSGAPTPNGAPAYLSSMAAATTAGHFLVTTVNNEESYVTYALELRTGAVVWQRNLTAVVVVAQNRYALTRTVVGYPNDVTTALRVIDSRTNTVVFTSALRMGKVLVKTMSFLAADGHGAFTADVLPAIATDVVVTFSTDPYMIVARIEISTGNQPWECTPAVWFAYHGTQNLIGTTNSDAVVMHDCVESTGEPCKQPGPTHPTVLLIDLQSGAHRHITGPYSGAGLTVDRSSGTAYLVSSTANFNDRVWFKFPPTTSAWLLNGTRLWHRTPKNTSVAFPPQFLCPAGPPPPVMLQRMQTGGNATTTARDVSTGELLWESANDGVFLPYALHQKILLISGPDFDHPGSVSTFQAMDARSGATLGRGVAPTRFGDLEKLSLLVLVPDGTAVVAAGFNTTQLVAYRLP
jgi:hypothetical protein